MQFRDSFFAMNTEVETIVEAGVPAPGPLISVKLLFDQQEERFSRFRGDSLVSLLNAGETVDDGWLAEACRMAIEAYEFTGGLFNPMVLGALMEAGYATSFEGVSGGAPRAQTVPSPARCLEVNGTVVKLTAGQLDLGGMVKGWTADLAVEALEDDYPDLFVNAGGDIRCAGSDGGGEGWEIRVEAPGGGPTIWEGRVSGAVATSTTMKRRWKTGGGEWAHHLINPATGLPSASSFVQVSAFGEAAWRSEVWAKAVLIGGEEAGVRARRAGFDVLTLDAQGRTELLKAFA